MPIEIKELVIRAVVVESPEGEGERGQPAESATPAGQAAVVEECVRQVLKILQRSRER